ncbi:CTLH/CRA C-terminal to lish motif domain-containing protein [Blakeslea trispora]|nr:CTLH/CRA C-terminal to lish motif domain-containing protein [Blakeslea trispora]
MVSREDCQAIVIEYLLHNCYQQSAKALFKDVQSLSDSTVDTTRLKDKRQDYLKEKNIKWNEIDTRKDISYAIQQGDIAKAFSLMETHFPDLIESYNNYTSDTQSTLHSTLYELRCQQFIETLRTQGDIKAVQFAQEHIRPWRKVYPDITNNVLILIAYHDLENENTRELLSQERRDKMAEQVNKTILESRHLSSTTSLEKIWRQKITVQEQLITEKAKESQNKSNEENTKTLV